MSSGRPVIGDPPADEATCCETGAGGLARTQARDTQAREAAGAPRPGPTGPIYLRHRFHGELGQLLRDYYADVLDQSLPPQLLALLESLRQKERSR